MKKFIVPALLAVCVFTVSVVFQRCTLLCQECDGLFLMAPDYFSWAFAQPLPISRIISDFLVQFYRISLSAPWIMAGLITIVFLLLRGISGRLIRFSDLAASLVSGLIWFLTAKADSPRIAVASILFLFPLWIVLTLCMKRKEGGRPLLNMAIASAVVVLASIVIALAPPVRNAETWARVKNGVIYGKWNAVLRAANPKAVDKDHELIPFALLALGEKGELGNRMFSYPVFEENDLDMCLEDDYYNSLFFRAHLYSALNCTNEAIHNISQLAVTQPHGASFLVLRKMAEWNYLAGNYELVEKFCKILDRSLTHHKFTSSLRRLMADGQPRPADSNEFRSTVDVISHNPAYNLLLLNTNGIHSASAADRLLCTLLLQKNMETFKSALGSVDFASELPVHYQEALALLPGKTDSQVSSRVAARFRSFQDLMQTATLEEQQKRFGSTYWFYYYYLQTDK